MKLDRNLNAGGRGKYGLIKNRRIAEIRAGKDFEVSRNVSKARVEEALQLLEAAGVLDWGTTPETEFFVIRLKDRHAGAALNAYATDARVHGDKEYAEEVYYRLACRAGSNHPNSKTPD